MTGFGIEINFGCFTGGMSLGPTGTFHTEMGGSLDSLQNLEGQKILLLLVTT